MIFKEYYADKLINKSITEYLALQNNDVVCIAGAGGKTTTLMSLKDELISTEKSVLLTTTTKIFKTQDCVVRQDEKYIKRCLFAKKWVITGCDLGTKIGAWDKAYLRAIMNYADITLIEADGAKCLPFKMPNKTEPVYLKEANKIVYLVGMSAIDKHLQDLCRWELLTDFLQKRPQDRLTKDDIIKVLLSKNGAQQYTEGKAVYIVLNQVDNLYLLQQAVTIAKYIAKQGMKIAISCYKD